jgi:hypothetical protein
MMRTMFAASFTAVVLAAPAPAQFYPNAIRPSYGPYAPNLYNRPPVSPYLNLLGGYNPGINYFLQTVPQFQQQQINAAFGSQLYGLEQFAGRRTGGTDDLLDEFPILPGTGHPTAFQTYGTYYNLGPNRTNGIRTAPRGAGLPQTAPPPRMGRGLGKPPEN